MTFSNLFHRIQLYSILALILFSCSDNDAIKTGEYKLGKVDSVELGRKLFFDTRLSIDNSVSCASCHHPEFAFTDGKTFSDGVYGRKSTRNAPSVLNLNFQTKFMFDAHISTLEMQAIVPIQDSNEMGIRMEDLVAKLREDSIYSAWSKKIYNREIDPFVITRSLADFQRTLTARDSKFDRFIKGDRASFNSSELNGWRLFSEKLNCIHCHRLPDLSNSNALNNGLYYSFGEDKGRFRINYDSTDIGKFKVPSLRNNSMTAPYMHDGSLKTIDAVINHYQQGGNNHFNQDTLIQPFILTVPEQRDLKNFLNTLTDTSYMSRFK